MSRIARMTGTMFGIGYMKPAPGTWGSLSALPLTYVFHLLGGFPLVLMSLTAAFVLGVWATRVLTEGRKDNDPSEIVIDEVAGQMVALLPLSYSAWSMGISITALWPGWIAGFVLFRLFDILKPGPVGWADRRHDAMGVMLDDIIAGVFAALGVIALAGLAHGVMGI